MHGWCVCVCDYVTTEMSLNALQPRASFKLNSNNRRDRSTHTSECASATHKTTISPHNPIHHIFIASIHTHTQRLLTAQTHKSVPLALLSSQLHTHRFSLVMHRRLDVRATCVTFLNKCYEHNTAPLEHDIKPDRHGNTSHRLAGEHISFASESLSGLLIEEDKSPVLHRQNPSTYRSMGPCTPHCANNPLL